MVLIAGPVREEVHLHMFLAHSEFYEKVIMIPESEKMWKEGKLVLDMTGLVMPKALKSIVSFIYTGAIKVCRDVLKNLRGLRALWWLVEFQLMGNIITFGMSINVFYF